MRFDPILPLARIKAMKAQGYWHDFVLTDYFDRCLADMPNKTAVSDFNSTAQLANRLTYRELAARVDRIALGLMRLGVERNDVVSCQLPNWWQFTALTLACVRIGAVINPIMPIFRERELKFMLGLAESKVFVIHVSFAASTTRQCAGLSFRTAWPAPSPHHRRRRAGELRASAARPATRCG